MPIAYMEHFLVQTTDIEKTCDWYQQVLDLRRGETPDFKFPVQWMYLGDRDVLHVTQGGKGVSDNRKKYLGAPTEATSGSGVIDHIGFRANGLKDMIAHLKGLGVPFTQRMVSRQGLYQLFLTDPNGVKIELNYANAEAIAEGIEPELNAEDLSVD